MKKLLSILILLLASFFSDAEMMAGDYRGMLELGPGASLVLGIEIQTTDGNKVVYLDSPNQGMVNHEVEKVVFTDDSISFEAPNLRAKFSGTFKDNQLIGVFTQGKDYDITMTKLSDKSIARLENETQWFGDLNVTPQATLPLVVNIAVIESGYFVTLDSPQQQSFGIPLTNFALDANSMSFESPLINASYTAKKVEGEWEGTFTQGAAMPLNLKKNRPKG